jgi:hypothetical protein
LAEALFIVQEVIWVSLSYRLHGQKLTRGWFY